MRDFLGPASVLLDSQTHSYSVHISFISFGQVRSANMTGRQIRKEIVKKEERKIKRRKERKYGKTENIGEGKEINEGKKERKKRKKNNKNADIRPLCDLFMYIYLLYLRFIYDLFSDASNSSDYTNYKEKLIVKELMTHRKCVKRKELWPNLRYLSSIQFEGLRKTMQNLRQVTNRLQR